VKVEVRSEHARGAAAARRLRSRARAFLAALGRAETELSVLVVGDAAMRRLNRAWRGKDRATDVLSFPAAAGGALLGDVVISLDTARRAAREDGRALGAELDRYLAHGILHLLGHDHEASPAAARRMARAEDALVGEGMLTAVAPRLPRPRGARERAGVTGPTKPGPRAPVLPRPRKAGERVGVRGRSGSGKGSRTGTRTSSRGSRSRSPA
jgi:probable rRNA maturation factor